MEAVSVLAIASGMQLPSRKRTSLIFEFSIGLQVSCPTIERNVCSKDFAAGGGMLAGNACSKVFVVDTGRFVGGEVDTLDFSP